MASSIFDMDHLPEPEIVADRISRRLWILAQCIAPGVGSQERFIAVVQEAMQQADVTLGIAEANKWADGFAFDPEMVKHNTTLFARFDYDITSFSASMLAATAANRISVQRVRSTLSSNNPELEIVCELAMGMPVLRPEVHVPACRQPLGALFTQTHCAVEKVLNMQYVERGLAFILPVDVVLDHAVEVHWNLASFALKSQTPSGRPIHNCSGRKGRNGRNNPAACLNSKQAKKLNEAKWGKIINPGPDDAVLMILHEQRQHPPDVKILLWIVDFKTAYSLLSFLAQHVYLMAMELTANLVIFFLAGCFGWTGTPFCFDPITRAMRFEFQQRLPGSSVSYVDDSFGIAPEVSVPFIFDTVQSLFDGLCGPGALATHKNKVGRRLTFIGYDFDLDTQCISIARKNVLRCLYCFMLIGESYRAVSVRTLERMASMATRYSTVCVLMRPFVAILYAAQKGKHRDAVVPLSIDLERSCILIQLVLVLSVIDEQHFARSFLSFDVLNFPIETIIEFDASLTGIGGRIFAVADDEVCVGAFIIDLTVLGLASQPQYQNTVEFLGGALGLKAAHALGRPVHSIIMRGDSMSAISWLANQRFKGDRVTNAAVMFTLATVLYNVERVVPVHVPAEGHIICDYLSRHSSYEDAQTLFPELRGVPLVDANASKLILLCDPKRVYSTDEEFMDAWRRIIAELRN